MYTFDKRTIDAAGAFLLGELERLDQTLHAPLYSVSWGRDIDLREDVSIADEISSFTRSGFAAPGGVNANGINWISGNATAIPGIALSIEKESTPLRLWGLELSYTIRELAAAQQVGRPIDSQKYEGMRIKNQMDIDRMVYVGDSAVGATGLVNNASIAPSNVSKAFDAATPDEILDMINGFLSEAWERTGYAVLPNALLVPPRAMSVLVKPVTAAGSESILSYVVGKCLCKEVNGTDLRVSPVKWLSKAGAGGSGRMVAYTKDKQYVRFPMVPLQHTELERRGLWQATTYYGALGEVEFVYPETVAYADGVIAAPKDDSGDSEENTGGGEG